MGLTISEKILLNHSKEKSVEPGQIINVSVDLIMANDVTAPLAIDELSKMGFDKVFNKDNVVFVIDHFCPNNTIKSAQNCAFIKDFAHKHQIKFYECGYGIEHALLPEEGLIKAGDVIIGGDSHTCTYGALGAFSTGVGSTDLAYAMATGELWFKVPPSIKVNYYGKLKPWVTGKDLILFLIGNIGVDGALYCAIEFTGEALRNISLDEKFTMCNMAVEAGAKNAIFEANFYKSDVDARYINVLDYDAGSIDPQVAFPHSPQNVKSIYDVKEDIYIDQAVIGSCTNGRIEDLRLAAKVLKGKKVYPGVRLLIIPATRRIFLQALREGLIEIFLEAGGVVGPPTCGPCFGGHMGILAQGEKCISTTNRNFVGRMGHPESEVYLANPAVVAASAIKGKIVSPEEVM